MAEDDEKPLLEGDYLEKKFGDRLTMDDILDNPRVTSDDSCTCCGACPLKCQVLSYGLLISFSLLLCGSQLFLIDKNDDFDGYFFFVYIAMLLPLALAWALYMGYYF